MDYMYIYTWKRVICLYTSIHIQRGFVVGLEKYQSDIWESVA